jgi:hypothetical protein
MPFIFFLTIFLSQARASTDLPLSLTRAIACQQVFAAKEKAFSGDKIYLQKEVSKVPSISIKTPMEMFASYQAAVHGNRVVYILPSSNLRVHFIEGIVLDQNSVPQSNISFRFASNKSDALEKIMSLTDTVNKFSLSPDAWFGLFYFFDGNKNLDITSDADREHAVESLNWIGRTMNFYGLPGRPFQLVIKVEDGSAEDVMQDTQLRTAIVQLQTGYRSLLPAINMIVGRELIVFTPEGTSRIVMHK